MKKKRLPIGVSDFKKIIEKNYYYVDKTNFIEEILDKRSEVTLITRPRRFGKTLNMTTLKYFLDIKESEENKKLFVGLNIEKSEYIDEQGKYPIIFLSMKDLEGNTYNEFYENFKRKISNLFAEYTYLRDNLNRRDLIEFDRIWFREVEGDYTYSLSFLSRLLHTYYKVKPVLLIDEYDSVIIKANEMEYYNKVKTLIGIFYGNGLKDGDIEFSVITGILRVAKESIFSTLNNFKVSSILSEDYNFFGMLENEVENMLKYYNLETTLENTKKWYNGYLFGKSRVYNPWSIINHCDTGKLESYWINTSANTLIMNMLEEADDKMQDLLYKLLKDGELKTKLPENMIFSKKYGNSIILYLMFSAGYLTIDKMIENENEKEYYLKIPNYEVRKYFKNTFIDILESNDGSSFVILEKALKDGNIKGTDSIEEIIQEMFISSMSYLDIAKEEKFYHNLILGMMIGLTNSFYIHSNRESGLGRYDLALEPKNKNSFGYIFEFKVLKDKESLEELSKQAFKQIFEKKYEQNMKNRGVNKIIKIVMIFFNKTLSVYFD